MPSARRWVRSRTVRLAAAAGLLATGLTLGDAEAATPTQGTLTDTAPG